MYKWSVYNFTDKEINQIVKVVQWWAGGPICHYDARKLSKQVRKWATYWNLLGWQCKHGIKVLDDDVPWFDYEGTYCKVCGRGKRQSWRLIASYDGRFSLTHHTPPEALWRLVEPLLYHDNGKMKGYSVIYDHRWRGLNIYPCRREGDKYQEDRITSERAFQDKLDLFGRLANEGYITWRTAGSVWNITILQQRKRR